MKDVYRVPISLILGLVFALILVSACTQTSPSSLTPATGVNPGQTPGPQNVPGQPGGIPAGQTCPGLQIWCNGRCVDPATDMGNCGGCMNPCQPGQPCINGKCGSEVPGVPGTPGIPGIPEIPGTPGILGTPAVTGTPVLTGTHLIQGLAVNSSCPSGQTLCGGLCVNIQTSSQHCGACGNPCPSGQTCEKGKCGIFMSVVDPQQICTNSGKLWCSWVCVDQKTDTSNCGACGKKCKSGEPCSQGQCLSWTGTWKITGGGLLTLVQTGTSVTGKTSALTLTGTSKVTNKANPPITADGTWSETTGTASGGFYFPMTADGKQIISGWTTVDGVPAYKETFTAVRQ
jgi:hypothetical protein